VTSLLVIFLVFINKNWNKKYDRGKQNTAIEDFDFFELRTAMLQYYGHVM
jgi:hypothetical protein